MPKKVPSHGITRLDKKFYRQTTLRVARRLLGCYFVRAIDGTLMIGKIVETEAYRHNDPACHAYKGRTQRTEVMFREGGFLYVYFTYGVHYCTCVVTDRENRGEAVLIRAVEPIVGIDLMMHNRGIKASDGGRGLRNLASGPGKFSKAFQLGRAENGKSLLGEEIYILAGKPVAPSNIGVSSRIGVTLAADKPWRFFVRGNAWVSRRS